MTHNQYNFVQAPLPIHCYIIFIHVLTMVQSILIRMIMIIKWLHNFEYKLVTYVL